MQHYNSVFVLTGAGISTESGIPDYRSAQTGLWNQMDPMNVSSLYALQREPTIFYQANVKHWLTYYSAEPNDAHKALALLEKKGHVRGIVTQNIDGLHQKAGSVKVWEVHGHLRTCSCLGCGKRYSFYQLIHQLETGRYVPLCAKCNQLLRPDVILFGDQMSLDFFRARDALKRAELLVVVGSSLQVYPAAELPGLAQKIVIINLEPTPWDDQAHLVIRRSAGEVFRELITAMGYTV